MKPNTPESFKSWIVPQGDCLVYSRYKNRKGYGRIKYNGRMMLSHRLAWELDRGVEPPPGLYVCHRCDNPSCCNPEHLFLGTATDNNRDRAAKGRGYDSSGERNHMHKLTNEQVGEVRALLKSGMRQPHIAAKYGVSSSLISLINTGKYRGNHG
jgi:hypothetical protein